jgi:hypothetical protein
MIKILKIHNKIKHSNKLIQTIIFHLTIDFKETFNWILMTRLTYKMVWNLNSWILKTVHLDLKNKKMFNYIMDKFRNHF